MYRASLNVWDEAACARVHNASLEVLAKTGVAVRYDKGLDLFRALGARVDGDRVRLDAATVERALRSAPRSWPLRSRGREEVLELADGQVHFDDRLGVPFVGLDVGWNAMPLRFVWGRVRGAGAVRRRRRPAYAMGDARRPHQQGPDLFAEDYPFPEVAEGDVVAILGTGGYCQAVVAPHCLRPAAPAVFFTDRLPD